MSGIINLGKRAFLSAISYYDSDAFEGCSGCEHLMDTQEGVWIHNDVTAKLEVNVFNERDCFGPGEVSLLCDACLAEEKSKPGYRCDFCHRQEMPGGDFTVSGHKAPDEPMYYMYCDDCFYKQSAAFSEDVGDFDDEDIIVYADDRWSDEDPDEVLDLPVAIDEDGEVVGDLATKLAADTVRVGTRVGADGRIEFDE